MKKIQSGFTLIELMIVVAIIGILAAVAIPSYMDYTKKAKFTELVQATQSAKVGVEMCYAKTGTITGCTGGAEGVPADKTGGASAQVESIETADGVITVTATAASGLETTAGAAATYVMTPYGPDGATAPDSTADESITWGGVCDDPKFC